MNRSVILAAIGAAAVALSPAPSEPPRAVSPRADALDLLVVGGEKPVRLELRVEVGGKSVPAIWDETFAKLFAFHDRNGDGTLDRTEAARLPSAFALRQVLWGQFASFPGDAPAWGELDLDADAKVGGDELADFYRRAGLGGVLVGVGRPPATDRLTDGLLKHLGANTDGKLAEAEWKAAADTLRKLDSNDDELIGPGELVDGTAYPGASGAILLTAPAADARPDAVTDTLPLVTLPLRTADMHWASAVAARRGEDRLPAVPADALRALRKDAPAAAWRVRLGEAKGGGPVPEAVGGKPPANARLVFAVSDLRMELRADEGKLAEQTAAARKRFAASFAECDADAGGTLDAQEIAAQKATRFKHLLATADRDADGKLGAKELDAWLDLQEQVARGHVLLTVLDHGRGLFELLDADHDGSLAVRELRSAWDRVKAAGCVTAGRFDRTKLPRQLIATASRGHPQATLGKPVRGGPEWFRAMDRNGDGDVSRREFTGAADTFDKLDSDRDGLVDAREAAADR